jgi:superfamily II DNA or RNA helicase
MLALRDYQEETLASLVGPDKTAADLVVCATGGGKTVMFAGLLDRELKPGRRTCW